jgi:anthranilate synthase/aminodeoxychorismate synthase-like glutamine amidotransferase
MLVMIDNYDSFTYNLVQYIGELGSPITVFRNDKVDLEEIRRLTPDRIVISPGPGDPAVDGGISNEVIRELGSEIPVLGVCLGHQCIGHVFGGKISRAERLMHGKTSSVYHNGKGLYTGVPSPFKGTRYHSLIVEDPVPDCLEVTAFTSNGEIMGLKHKEQPVQGVQFHPESILTEHGKRIIRNFLEGR